MIGTVLPLLETEDVRRAIFDRLDHHVFLFEPDPVHGLLIADANESALRDHGYTREELLGRPVSLIDPETPPELLRASLAALERGESFRRDLRHRRKDGTLLDVEARAVLVRTGKRSLVLSVERDITERKRAERRLAHSHALMSYVIAHARSAIAVHDRELRYVYVSERYLREYGVAETDVIGRHHYDVFPDLPQKWRDVHQRSLRGEVVSSEQDSYERADGSVDWTRWECRPWYEADGSIGGIVVYTEVITDRVRAEEQRKALEAQLHQAMKMESVGRLAGGIAHDFNNLLTAILGNLELATRDLPAGHPVIDRLQDVISAAEGAASLTRQLLAFSRKQLIEPRVLDVGELVSNLRKLLMRLIGEDVGLRVELAEELPPVRVDPGQFEQVLVNLAVNARDAMPEGGELVIATSAVELDDEYCARHAEARPGRYVVLAVSDTGHGMSEEVKRHLFEPFFTTKPRGRGTGLGLATTYGIVKQAGGSIEVESEPGRGTRFRIHLPALEGLASALARETKDLPRGSETVLLVEDDPAVRKLAASVLARLGYTVLEAASGPEALASSRS